MISKKMYAKHIVNEYIQNRKLDPQGGYKDLNEYVKDNASLGIALDILGYLDEDNKQYIENRNGTPYVICYDRLSVHTLTTREIMDMLPDDV